MTRKELIDAVSRDWLERNGEHFVHIRTKGALEWEKNVGRGGSFADYLYGPQDTEDLIRNAVPYARNMITAMNPGMKVNVCLSGSPDSYTDGRSVCLSTDMFDDRTVSSEQKLDIFLGHAIHEGSHLLYTDFNLMREALRKDPNPIFKNIFNIVEDEMIENTLGEEKRGLALFIMKVKDYLWGRHVRQNGPNPLSNDNILAEIINCTLGRIRYPSLLTEDLIVRHGRFLLKLTDILTPFPKNTAESLEASRRITELIEKEYQDQKQKQQQQNGNGESGESREENSDGNSGGNGSQEQQRENKKDPEKNDREQHSGKDDSKESGREEEKPSDDGKDNGEKSSEGKSGKDKPDGKQDSSSGSSKDKDSGTEEQQSGKGQDGPESSTDRDTGKDSGQNAGGKSGNGAGADGTEDLGDLRQDYTDTPLDEKTRQTLYENFRKIMDKLADLSDTPSPQGKENPKKSAALTDNNTLQYCEGKLDKTESHKFFSKKMKDNKRVYDLYKEQIKGYVYGVRNAVRLHLKEYRYIYRGMRDGKLDESKIVEACIGSPCVYTQQGMSKCDRLNVCILIDESGSMSGDKIRAATRTAVLLNEALKDLPGISLFIYGHKERLLTVYREPGHNQPWALGGTLANGGTPTGNALKEIRRRIRKHTGEKTLVFLIGDGAPNESPYEMRPILASLEKDNLPVVSISIDKSFRADQYYPRNINLLNFDQADALSTLAPKLGALIRETVIKNTARKNTRC